MLSTMERAQFVLLLIFGFISLCSASEGFEDHLRSVTDVNNDAPVLLGAAITEASKKDKADIDALLELWTDDKLDRGLGQGTILEFKKKPGPKDYKPNRPGWRIDIQQNGAFPKDGISYYGLAIQNVDKKNKQVVYSSALVPVNENVGAALIREAFLDSVAALQVAVIFKNPTTNAWAIRLEN